MRFALALVLLACTSADAMAPATDVPNLVTAGWSATGGTITQDGIYRAGTTPGTYRVTYTTAEGMADTSLVTVCALASLTLSTHDTTLTHPDTLALTAVVTNSCAVVDTSIAVTFTSRTPATATAASNGTQAARVITVASGYTWVVAVAGSRRDSARVCVNPGLAVDVVPAGLGLAPSATGGLTATVTTCAGSVDSTVAWVSRNTGIATVVSTGDRTATVTGVAAGAVYVVADEGSTGAKDSALVAVSAGPPPVTVSSGCPTSGYLDLVAVDTKSELDAAISTATAGDQIRLAAGTYAGALPTISRSGTEANPIVICGPRTAIVDLNQASNVRLQANYWHFRGFRITDFPSTGFHIGADASTANNHHNIIDSLEIDHATNELLAINGTGHHNIIRDSYFHDSGVNGSVFAEGVYVCESTNTTKCYANQILRNRFERIRTESVDLKGGADSTVVSGNSIDGTGTVAVDNNAVSLISVASDYNTVTGNHLSFGNPHGIVFWNTSLGTSVGSAVTNNTIRLFNLHGSTAPKGIWFHDGGTAGAASPASCTGNVVTNIPSGGSATSGATCTP